MEEVKEAEKVVIAKPVASRPTCSSFRSFSDLLADAINASPSNESTETAVTAIIRPRTVRLNPAVGVVSSQADSSKAAVCSPSPLDQNFKPDRKSNVVYKPTAKFASMTKEGADLGNKQELAQVEDTQQPNLAKYQTDHRLELHQKFLSPAASDKHKRREHSKLSSSEEIPRAEEYHRSSSHTTSGDRASYDGYNWRKYGQKQVKGSEYPRSYYKCTHPNCPAKKKIERSLKGQIAEIVYKSEHNHPKPHPLKHNSSDEQWQGNMGIGSNERHVGTAGNLTAFGLSPHSSCSGGSGRGRVQPIIEHAVAVNKTNLFGASLLYNSSGRGGVLEEGTKRLGAPESSDEPMSKRRKYDDQFQEAGTSSEGITKEPAVVVQNAIDSAIIRDGFRWRKYGQKVVKGNPYPRSYYRCTNLKCNVRKYVERTSDEPNAFVTTYEGKHNHEMPIKNTTNSVAAAKTSSSKAVGS